jgi:tRNA_anti-like
MKLKTIIFVVVLCAIGYFLYAYLYHGHRDFATEEAIKLESSDFILAEFQKDEKKANTLYLNKVLEIKGTISQLDTLQKVITLDKKLFASFQEIDFKNLKLQDEITIKGRLIGYDELLEELKIDNCIIKN